MYHVRLVNVTEGFTGIRYVRNEEHNDIQLPFIPVAGMYIKGNDFNFRVDKVTYNMIDSIIRCEGRSGFGKVRWTESEELEHTE